MFHSGFIDADLLLAVNVVSWTCKSVKLGLLQMCLSCDKSRSDLFFGWEHWVFVHNQLWCVHFLSSLGSAEGVDLKVMEWRDGVFVRGRDFIVFHSKLVLWTNVFHIIRAWRRVGGCVYEMHERLWRLQSSWSKNLKPCDLNQHRAFSHRGTCWGSHMEKETKRWIDQVRLITPSLPDFNKRNPPKKY